MFSRAVLVSPALKLSNPLFCVKQNRGFNSLRCLYIERLCFITSLAYTPDPCKPQDLPEEALP